MAINVTLYSTGDAVNVVGKTKTQISTHTVTLKDGCSADRPVVQLTGAASSLASANYAYIDVFARYYWIGERKSLLNGVIEVSMTSDPWESFKTELEACEAIIERNENTLQGYLKDDSYPLLSYNKIATVAFPQALPDEGDIILMTVG